MTPAAVHVSGLTRRFAGATAPAVDNVTLTVSPGSILALLGPSGAGKTTLLRMIAGFERADAGSVTIGAQLMSGPGVHVPPEQRPIGFVFQNGTLFPHLDVRRNIAFGLKQLDAHTRAARIQEVAALCEIEPLLARLPHELSGGEQQRAALARALARNTSVVLLDEPMSNVDVRLRAELGAQLRDILCHAHTTAILVTHDHEDAFALADTIGVMHQGRLEQLSAPETVYARPASAFVGRFVGAANFLPARITAQGIETEIGTFSLNGKGEGEGDARERVTRGQLPAARHVEDTGAGAQERVTQGQLSAARYGRVSARAGAGEGERVDAMLRPAELRLEPDDASLAVIVSARFLGNVHAYEVRLPSGLVLRCEMDARQSCALEPGQRVRIVALTRHPRCFPR